MKGSLLTFVCLISACDALAPRVGSKGLSVGVGWHCQRASPLRADSDDFDEREKIISDLMLATNQRDQENLTTSLMAAMKAGIDAEDPPVRAAREVLQELQTGMSSTMRQKLMREAQSTGADETIDWNPGFTYLGIFAVISVLVVLGGKGIFY